MGYSATVFDLRVLRPLKLNRIFESVQQTGRLLTVDTGFKMFGIGAEIVAEVTENCFSHLKNAPSRLGLPDHPIPSSKSLTKNVYLTGDIILKNIFKMLKLKITKQKIIMEDYKNLIKNKIIDTPNNNFKGPF